MRVLGDHLFQKEYTRQKTAGLLSKRSIGRHWQTLGELTATQQAITTQQIIRRPDMYVVSNLENNISHQNMVVVKHGTFLGPL